MVATTSIIETGVDKLVALVKQSGRISIQDAAKTLGVSISVIEEWADFLEEEGIVSMEYKFTKPFLVERKLTKKEIETKVKEFNGKKDIFVRKAEITMGFLDKEANRLKKLKVEFDKLKKELGIEVEGVKKELKQLDKYEQIKKDLDKKLLEQKETSKKTMDDMHQLVIKEQNKYKEILQEITKEEEELKREKEETKTIEESEERIKQKLSELNIFIKKLEDKLESEESKVGISEKHIEKLKNLAERIKENVEKDKKQVELLMNKSLLQEKNIMDLQTQTLEKIKEEGKKLGGYETASKKLKKFFSERMKIFEMIDKINKDRDDMEKELVQVIKKARSIELSKADKDVAKHIFELEKKFKEVSKKKDVFEGELKKLSSFLGLS